MKYFKCMMVSTAILLVTVVSGWCANATVTEITPNVVAAGDEVTIKGSNFDKNVQIELSITVDKETVVSYITPEKAEKDMLTFKMPPLENVTTATISVANYGTIKTAPIAINIYTLPNKTAAKTTNQKTDISQFEGWGFGAGLSLTIDTGKHKRVESASVVNGIVRVSEDRNDIPRIMLESHYFFLPFPAKWIGMGPFVAIQPGVDNVIEAVGAGVMFGFKKDTKDNSKSNSWNIGVGMVVDPNSKVLGDGVQENSPLPPGETDVRLKRTAQWGVLFMTSYAF